MGIINFIDNRFRFIVFVLLFFVFNFLQLDTKIESKYCLSLHKTQDLNKISKLKSYQAYKNLLGYKESRNNPYIASQSGYIGKYQFGVTALVESGVVNSINEAYEFQQTFIRLYEDHKNAITDEEKQTTKKLLVEHFPESEQEIALDNLVKKQEKLLISELNRNGKNVDSLDDLVGDTISGFQITKSGLIAATHLVGSTNVVNFIISDGQSVISDGNGVSLTYYLEKFANFEIIE